MASITRGYSFGATEQVTNSKLHTLVDSATLSSIAQTDLSAGLGLVSIGTSAPSDTDQLWVDTSLATYVLKHYDGTNWVPSVENQVLTNKSGQSLGAGVVVIIDTSNSNSVSVTSTEGNLLFGGINFTTVANNAAGVFKRVGYVPSILLETSASAGCFLRTSTATGKATQCASGVGGIFGVVTQAGTASAAGFLFNSTTQLTTSASAASQAEMETATNTANPVVPGRVQYHPGVAKAWVLFNGTGTPAVVVSHNVDSSITDNGTCDYTLSWTTDFSGTGYALAGICEPVGGAVHVVAISDSAAPAAGTFRVETFAHDNTQGSDSAKISVIAFGDQA